jgi:hypothetical protein
LQCDPDELLFVVEELFLFDADTKWREIFQKMIILFLRRCPVKENFPPLSLALLCLHFALTDDDHGSSSAAAAAAGVVSFQALQHSIHPLEHRHISLGCIVRFDYIRCFQCIQLLPTVNN